MWDSPPSPREPPLPQNQGSIDARLPLLRVLDADAWKCDWKLHFWRGLRLYKTFLKWVRKQQKWHQNCTISIFSSKCEFSLQLVGLVVYKTKFYNRPFATMKEKKRKNTKNWSNWPNDKLKHPANLMFTPHILISPFLKLNQTKFSWFGMGLCLFR